MKAMKVEVHRLSSSMIAFEEVLKGYPEFNPDQARDEGGRWAGEAAGHEIVGRIKRVSQSMDAPSQKDVDEVTSIIEGIKALSRPNEALSRAIGRAAGVSLRSDMSGAQIRREAVQVLMALRVSLLSLMFGRRPP